MGKPIDRRFGFVVMLLDYRSAKNNYLDHLVDKDHGLLIMLSNKLLISLQCQHRFTYDTPMRVVDS